MFEHDLKRDMLSASDYQTTVFALPSIDCIAISQLRMGFDLASPVRASTANAPCKSCHVASRRRITSCHAAGGYRTIATPVSVRPRALGDLPGGGRRPLDGAAHRLLPEQVGPAGRGGPRGTSRRERSGRLWVGFSQVSEPRTRIPRRAKPQAVAPEKSCGRRPPEALSRPYPAEVVPPKFEEWHWRIDGRVDREARRGEVPAPLEPRTKWYSALRSKGEEKPDVSTAPVCFSPALRG